MKSKGCGRCAPQSFFCPQTATNRLCGVCRARSGTCPTNSFERHRAKQEVHKLCVVVFDFLEYDILLLCQRSGQFLLMTNHKLCGNVILTAAHYFELVRSDIAVVKVFECGHCCTSFPSTTGYHRKRKSPEKSRRKTFFRSSSV